MRIPFFSKKNGQDRGLHFKNSNITGDVSIDSVGEGSDAIGVDLFNSNITGNITINYNGGTEALEEKIDSILNNLRDTMEKQHPNDATTFANDFEEVQNVVNHEPAVPSAVDSMEKLARVLRESGYYAESNQVQIDIAELMIETDSVVTQIHGIIHLCQNDRTIDWFDHLRRALKLAIENDLEKEKYRIHVQLFSNYNYYHWKDAVRIEKIREKSHQLLQSILKKAVFMSAAQFIKRYGDYPSEVMFVMTSYMETKNWKLNSNTRMNRALLANIKSLLQGDDKYLYNLAYKPYFREIKFKLLYPKTDFLLEIPGVFWGLFFAIFTLGHYDPTWTYHRTKSWAFTIIVTIGLWYFLI